MEKDKTPTRPSGGPAELLVSSFKNPKFRRRICLEDAATGKKLTYNEMDLATALAAGVLKSFYINPGDTVSILLQNGLHFFMPWLGAMRVGAVAHPINYLYTPEQMIYALELCETKLLVTEDRYFDCVPRIRERFPSLPILIIGEKGGYLGTFDWQKLLRFVKPYDHVIHRYPEDPFQLVCTSGTTGKPKAVVQHCGMMEPNVRDLIDVYKLTGQDRTLLINRLFHVNAQVTNFYPMTVLGGRTVLAPPDPAKFLYYLKKHKITYSSVIPPFLKSVLLRRQRSEPQPRRASGENLRFLIVGADILPKELHREFMERTGISVRPGWGMTETLCWGSGTPEGDPIIFGSCGTPLPHTEMKIVDGRLYVRGDNVFKQYFRNPEATAKAFVTLDGKEYFDTGDVFRQDSRGTYYFVCRASADSWKVRGEFIVGPEIDEYVRTHPEIDDAISVPVTLDGETESAICVQLKQQDAAYGHDFLLEEKAKKVLEYCEAGRGTKLDKHYKIKGLFFVAQIELGDTGKRSRKKMTELATEALKGNLPDWGKFYKTPMG